MATVLRSPTDFSKKRARLVEGDAEPLAATDGELLMQFTRHGDERAFAEIVERHGGLVWMVCRELLGHHQDIEDAFQATFFILAERAQSIRTCDSAAAWLYKVAQRTSLAARRKRSRLREEELGAEVPQVHESLPLGDQQMIHVLMEELRTMPVRYQVPLVLRYLEGRSRRAIAEETDSTLAQIQGRLVRGRRLLRSRMARRGVSLSLASGALVGISTAAKAAVTPGITVATAQSCLALKTSGATVSATAAAMELARQGAKAMWVAATMKTAAAVSGILLAASVCWGVEAGIAASDGVDAAGKAARVAATSPVEKDGGASVIIGNRDAIDKASLAQSASPPGEGQRTSEMRRDTARQPEEQIQFELANRRNSLSGEIERKAEVSAELELAQLERSMAQRELEKTHEAALALELEPQNGVSDEEQRHREEQLMRLKKRIEGTKQQLREQALGTAKLAAALEAKQMAVQRAQQQLEGLEAATMGLNVPHDVLVRAPQPSLPRTPGPMVERRPMAGMPPQLVEGQEMWRMPEQASEGSTVESRSGDSADVAQLVPLQMERDSWRMKAEALRVKAEAAKKKAAALRANGNQTDSENGLADSVLLQADAAQAEAMAATLATRIEALQGAEQKRVEAGPDVKVRMPGVAMVPSDIVMQRKRAEDQVMQAVGPQMEAMRKQLEALHKENSELKEEMKKLQSKLSSEKEVGDQEP